MDANRIRIYKNTMFLYMRTLLVMFVTLYTTRIILSALGVEDYGIFNVVGGVVTLLAVFNNSMSAASSRYISYAIGKKDDNLISSSYSTIKRIHLILAIIVFILSETIGLWFVCSATVSPLDSFITYLTGKGKLLLIEGFFQLLAATKFHRQQNLHQHKPST